MARAEVIMNSSHGKDSKHTNLTKIKGIFWSFLRYESIPIVQIIPLLHSVCLATSHPSDRAGGGHS